MTATMAAGFVPEGGLILVLSRAAFDAALLSLGGVLLFRDAVVPKVVMRSGADAMAAAERALQRLTRASLIAAPAALIVWTLLQDREFAGTGGIGTDLAALRPVLLGTEFGHLVLVQAAGLGLVAFLSWAAWPRAAAIAAAAGVALQAAHGHGTATGGFSLPLFSVGAAHLLAASAWIGGLAPLLLVIRRAPFRTAALAARGFSPLGKWSVAVLAGSSFVQGWVLVGSVRAFFETAYGFVALGKIGCFVVLLALAVLNRYRLAPALLGTGAVTARRRLLGAIALQTATGLLAVLLAAVLGALEPGMDMGRSS